MSRRTERYLDVLHVALGPYSRKLPFGGTKVVVKNWFSAILHPFKLLKDVFLFGSRKVDGQLSEGGVWLLAGSKNNLDSLQFLEEGLEQAVFVITNKKVGRYGDFPRLLFHEAIKSIWQFWPLFFQLLPTFGKQLWRHPHQLAFAIGKIRAARKILAHYRPQALIFSNDHHSDMRGLLWAANQLSIPTIYIQHASVSEYFPPLRFSLNLLEGEDSLAKYRRCGSITGKVELVGMPKFDEYHIFRRPGRALRKVGICANLLDNGDRLTAVSRRLSERLPELEFTFRKHPREERDFSLPEVFGVSDPTQEKVFAFLKEQDLVVAGDTSTHLEAVLLNIPSIYFRFHQQKDDYFGYVANGLIDRADSIESLIEAIKAYQRELPEVLHRAKYYNATIGTEWEGKSQELALRHINELLNEGS